MNKPVIPLLLSLLLGNFALAQAAEKATTVSLQEIESLQRRVRTLAFGELGPDNYHLSKARAWLDLALSEYFEKDTSGSLLAAIGQAEALLDALESKQANIGLDTPVQVPGSEPVRPDLLERIAVLKQHEKFTCGQRQLATAEVYLVWAGHEHYESGISHSQSYVRSVENLVYEAKVAIDNCLDAPAVAQILPPPALEKVTLSGDALFAFNKSTLKKSALWRLDNLADNIRTVPRLEEVILVGHTDRMRKDGRHDLNQLLSEKRAISIKQYLIGKGIPADKIRAIGAGSSQPLVQCSIKQSRDKQIACLQPNRRVEITFHGSKYEPGMNNAPAYQRSDKNMNLEAQAATQSSAAAPVAVAISPAPVEPAPVEPAPVEPAPVKPAPVKPAPVEPAPVEPAPVAPAPVVPAPVVPAPVVPAPVAPAPTSTSTEASLEMVTLSGDALFKFGKATLNSSALWRLDKLVSNFKALTQPEEIILVGHTDHLRRDGRHELNQLLSEQRAESVRQYLIKKGVPADKIHASGAGSSQPLVKCSTKKIRRKQIACLQPNRRVEITLRGVR